MRIAFLIFAGIVLILSLYPLAFDWTRRPGWNLPLGLIHSRSDWVDLVANFFFYLPLGFTGALAWARRPGVRLIWWAAVCGAVLSYSVEVAQLYMPRRYSSWRDVVLNTAGTAAGAWLATRPVWRRLPAAGKLGSAPVAWWLLACWTTWLVFPYYPALAMVQLRRAVEHSLAEFTDPAFPVLLAGMHLFGGMMLALAARRPGPVSWAIPALALGAVAWMTLIIHLRFSPGRMVATLAGFGAVHLLDLARRRWLAAACAGGWLTFYCFYGCDLSNGAPQAFAWQPLAGWERSTLVVSVRAAAGLALISSALAWTLRCCGAGRGMTALAVVGLVAAGEGAQRYAPGRTPGLTDVLIAALAVTVVLGLADDPPGRQRR